MRALLGVRSGEGDYRPAGNRTLWLPELDVPDDLWASFQIPIGLAFFMDSTVTGCVVAMYPSPAGATEIELHFESWRRMRELNPVLSGLEPDIEGLIVNRLVGSAGVRDRADRPLLRADGSDQDELGGDLGRPRRRGRGGRSSSTASARRSRGPGRERTTSADARPPRGRAPRARVRGPRACVPVRHAAAPMLTLRSAGR